MSTYLNYALKTVLIKTLAVETVALNSQLFFRSARDGVHLLLLK